jgi:hypothetical protein
MVVFPADESFSIFKVRPCLIERPRKRVCATRLPKQLLESMKITAQEDADPFRNADYSEKPNQNM